MPADRRIVFRPENDHGYTPRLRTVDVEHPHIHVVPGEHADDSAVIPRGKTWGIRVRGDVDGRVRHSYVCPVHGQFDAMVSRASVPDAVPCELISWSLSGGDKKYATRDDAGEAALQAGIDPESDASYESQRCDATSSWAGSLCGIGISSGYVES